jgi:hypothetical protein
MLHTIYIIAALLLGPQASLATIDQRMMLVSWIVCCVHPLVTIAVGTFHVLQTKTLVQHYLRILSHI